MLILLSRFRKTGLALGLLTAVLFALTFTHLTGCASPAWYSQAISGHLDLMARREDIDQVLASGSIDPETARELELAVEIREFAISRLALPANDSYTQFVPTGKDAVTWNVVAAPEFSLEPRQWCFMVSGCVPYRGYFKRAKAENFARKLADDGLDTTVSPAMAYSTLGWFDDPLLDTMLRYNDEQLAGFIFHELAHQQFYVKGDTAFNEAYASFVEETGVGLWLESTGRASRLPAWRRQEKASLQVNSLLQETRTKLEKLYLSGLPDAQMRERKSLVFEELRDAYLLLVETQWDGRNYHPSLLSGEMNNARLALINSYQGGACAFEDLYRSAGSDMSIFHQMAAAKANMESGERTSWLNQPCNVIASNGDL